MLPLICLQAIKYLSWPGSSTIINSYLIKEVQTWTTLSCKCWGLSLCGDKITLCSKLIELCPFSMRSLEDIKQSSKLRWFSHPHGSMWDLVGRFLCPCCHLLYILHTLMVFHTLPFRRPWWGFGFNWPGALNNPLEYLLQDRSQTLWTVSHWMVLHGRGCAT